MKVKNLILGLTLILAPMMTLPVMAGQYTATQRPDRVLRDADGNNIEDLALTSGSAVFSETISMVDNIGFATLLVIEDKAGGAGDVDISVEYTLDGTTFYPAYTADLSGTITADGLIVEAIQDEERWIAYPVRMARGLRYKFDPDADSQITAYHLFLRDR